MKTTVIYHSADYDGIFCREIARHFLPGPVLIGWNFGDKLIPFPEEGLCYILDLSPDCLAETSTDNIDRIIWIDHHKTSIDKWAKAIPGYRIDGVAACRLTWQWFSRENSPDRETIALPMKLNFVNRQLHEPLAVLLAGEYDIWDKRDPRAETFQYALRAAELTPDVWERLLRNEAASENMVSELMPSGEAAQRYQQKTDSDLVTHRSYRLIWEGLNFIVLNTGRFNSLTFAAIDKPETGHDALLGYMFNGKVWTVSLYHAKHRTEIDLSAIAVKHGGGGHRGACGFTCGTLPF
jgi:hypothetical protein